MAHSGGLLAPPSPHFLKTCHRSLAHVRESLQLGNVSLTKHTPVSVPRRAAIYPRGKPLSTPTACHGFRTFYKQDRECAPVFRPLCSSGPLVFSPRVGGSRRRCTSVAATRASHGGDGVPSHVGGHSGSFQFGAIVDSAARNAHTYVFG